MKSCPLHLSKNYSSCLHETPYKYQLTLGGLQNARTITFAFVFFELFSFDSVTIPGTLYNIKTVRAIFKILHIDINQH